MDLQTSADNDWNEEIFVVLDSELAFAFSFAMDSAEKWKIVVGHHPVRSIGHHGDTKELIR